MVQVNYILTQNLNRLRNGMKIPLPFLAFLLSASFYSSSALLATGDTDAYTRITKVMDAEEELGIGNVEGLPVKGNNKIDTKQLRRGRIYTDITGATKAKYVVIDQGGMDHYTNSAEEAKQLVELV